MSGWLARRWYDLAYWPCFLATIFGFSLRVAGRRNMPAAGPVLVLSNHQSHLDPVLLGVASPRRLASLARRTLFRNRFFAALIRSLGAFPIDQEGVGKEGIKTVLDLLASGRAVVVYPEGHRTPDGRLQPLLPGISLILRRARVPVVPCGIAGAYHAWPRSRNYPVPSPLFCPASERTIAVAIGEPIPPERFEGLSREATLELLAGELERMAARAEQVRRKK